MKLPKVYPILDTGLLATRGISLETAAAALLEGGAEILQIRHKTHWTRDAFAAAEKVAVLCRKSGALFIVNDRADFALLLSASLHVGQDDLPPSDARKLLGPNAVIGFSTHNPAQLTAAEREPVDYVAIGPIFTTGSKAHPDPVVGVEQLRRWRPLSSKPLVAIGGITLENAGEVWNAGADSVAVIGGMLPPMCEAQGLWDRMEEWLRLAAHFSG